MLSRERTGGLAAALVLLLLAVTASAGDPTGVEGIAAFRGDFTAGAVVFAFSEAGADADGDPVAVSGPTDEDGRYQLHLPVGKYHLLAVKRADSTLKPGDLFCYYLGNPIVVVKNRMTRVGFNMIEVRPEGKVDGGDRSGVSGSVLFEDLPLGRAYIYVYRDGATNFRGMGMTAIPADEKGRFRIKLPAGKYYLLARKRKAGGMYGPPLKDDYIGYYHGNPVTVERNHFIDVKMEMTTRVDLLEEIWYTEGKSAGWFTGSVVDSDGTPIAGLYVFFYPGPETTGAPAFIAGPTESDGLFKVRSAPGRFTILARKGIGGKPAAGEWYGEFRTSEGGKDIEMILGEDIRIVVSRTPSP